MPVRKYGRCSKLKPSTEHDTGKNPEGDIISHRFETLEYLRRRPLGSVQSNAVEPASEEPKIGEALAAANGTVRFVARRFVVAEPMNPKAATTRVP